MKSTIWLVALTSAALQAGSMTLLSGQGSGSCTSLNYMTSAACNNVSFNNVDLANPEAVWATDAGGAQWISFEQTGVGGIALTNSTTENLPNAKFYQTFTDNNGTALTLNAMVWADDTAAVYLDGVMLYAPSFTLGVHCSTGITCVGAGTMVTDNNITPGTHTLEFDVYQVGFVTYGLMYDATVTDNDPPAAPEPASCVLFGTGLAGLALLRKRIF